MRKVTADTTDPRITEAVAPVSASLLMDVAGPSQHAAVLRDLIWTLYAKLAAVLEAHRVVYEVSRWIAAVGQKNRKRLTPAAGIQGFRVKSTRLIHGSCTRSVEAHTARGKF